MTLSCFTWPQTRLGLAKTPGTCLPESLPTSKTLSPPGQVPFVAHYILPYTFFVFSPLSVKSCADLQPPSHQLENEVEWTRRVSWGWRWSSGFLQSSGHWSVSCMLRERKPWGGQVSLSGDSRHHALSPQSFLNWRRRSSRPPTCSPLLPLQSPSETKGKQLGNLSDWPLLDWGNRERLARPST